MMHLQIKNECAKFWLSFTKILPYFKCRRRRINWAWWNIEIWTISCFQSECVVQYKAGEWVYLLLFHSNSSKMPRIYTVEMDFIGFLVYLCIRSLLRNHLITVPYERKKAVPCEMVVLIFLCFQCMHIINRPNTLNIVFDSIEWIDALQFTHTRIQTEFDLHKIHWPFSLFVLP